MVLAEQIQGNRANPWGQLFAPSRLNVSAFAVEHEGADVLTSVPRHKYTA
jgi:hypothetical protein